MTTPNHDEAIEALRELQVVHTRLASAHRALEMVQRKVAQLEAELQAARDRYTAATRASAVLEASADLQEAGDPWDRLADALRDEGRPSYGDCGLFGTSVGPDFD